VPRRADLRSILIVGSGPIRIGQGCEFDYSASQACRVLRREGIRVVLVNSNPATIMTDPEWADATYIEPLDVETITEVIAAELPDALLPTLGGQTALNLAVELCLLWTIIQHCHHHRSLSSRRSKLQGNLHRHRHDIPRIHYFSAQPLSHNSRDLGSGIAPRTFQVIVSFHSDAYLILH